MNSHWQTLTWNHTTKRTLWKAIPSLRIGSSDVDLKIDSIFINTFHKYRKGRREEIIVKTTNVCLALTMF